MGADGWELRVASDLAVFMSKKGARSDALGLLKSVFDRFHEGLDTEDLSVAKHLLADLNSGD